MKRTKLEELGETSKKVLREFYNHSLIHFWKALVYTENIFKLKQTVQTGN